MVVPWRLVATALLAVLAAAWWAHRGALAAAIDRAR